MSVSTIAGEAVYIFVTLTEQNAVNAQGPHINKVYFSIHAIPFTEITIVDINVIVFRAP